MSKRCFYCGIKTVKGTAKINKSLLHRLLTEDHLVPRSRGGRDIHSNKVWACHRCNNEKGGLTFNEYRAVVALRRKQITINPVKIFHGERLWNNISAVPVTQNQIREILLDNMIAVMVVFTCTKLIPIFVRQI